MAAARLAPTPLPSSLLSALESLHDIQDHVRAHKYPQARRALNRLTQDLSEPDAALSEVRRHVSVHTLDAALTSLEAAETARHVEPEALTAALQPALDLPLTRAEALNSVGVLHAIHEETGQARQLFEQAAEADAGHYRAVSNIGNLELQAGNFKEAEAAQRRAIALNPDFAGAHHNLGVALRRQGRVNDSVKAIRRGQRLSVRRMREDAPRLSVGSAANKGLNAKWLTPANLRIIGLVVAALVFYFFLKGR
ncbi:tetratricopeptide repeat protein [Deinococcus psychrotolerans]|uniref:Tetratricopeptide repeat protein n=3 Tax=Deinococcaceae TaxID=183710 RepID=A0A553UMF4_9DEIO|nr:tetratricopeptide repeat protein [Deinococcus psychrotolerans]TSA81400.1 tetratricopeptide repeat protein [Deinococcus detaillensis]